MAMDVGDSAPIAIVGAGLVGLFLAVSLVHQDCYRPELITIYETRKACDPPITSGVALEANGLRLLDEVGVLERIADRCFVSEHRTILDEDDRPVGVSHAGSAELYGYPTHRVWRSLLLARMREMLEERGVRILWGSKLEKVVQEDDHSVTFLVDGVERKASFLVGADGIHSTVRKFLDPNVEPEYLGIVSVLGHVPWDAVRWPRDDYEKASTIQGKPGALILTPENREGTELMVARQLKMEPQTRKQWEQMSVDRDIMSRLYRSEYNQWGATARNIIDTVCRYQDSLYLWPFRRVELQNWVSAKGRVVVMGDAAHAMPPSSGQGINTGIEDAYAFTKLLKAGRGRDLLVNIKYWEQLRQDRIRAVWKWTQNFEDVRRLPKEEREALVREGKVKDPNGAEKEDLGWLFKPDLSEVIEGWLRRSR